MIPPQRPYTAQDDETLLRRYPDISIDKPTIARDMGRSVSSIEKRATRLGIVRGVHPNRKKPTGAVPGERTSERKDAENQAERIRAYYSARGILVEVIVTRVAHGPGKEGGWAAKIVTPIALGGRK